MTPFAGLQAFIRSNQEDPAAIRLYVEENAPELAEAFNVEVPAMLAKVAGLSDDSVGRKLVAEIKRVQKLGKDSRAADKLKAAQEAADAIGAAAVWTAKGAHFELAELLEHALTKPTETLVFDAGLTCSVTLDMAPLFRLRAATTKKWQRDALVYVDSRGLHIRWGKAGGLNLGYPTVMSRASANPITVRLPPREAAQAA